jgi:hypothetical protein
MEALDAHAYVDEEDLNVSVLPLDLLDLELLDVLDPERVRDLELLDVSEPRVRDLELLDDDPVLLIVTDLTGSTFLNFKGGGS